MEYSIDLQPAAYDRTLWYIVVLAFLAAAVVFTIIFIIVRKKLKALEAAGTSMDIPVQNVPYIEADFMRARQEALGEIAAIEANYLQKKIDSREAALRLSITVRTFIKNMTSREADCETYEELRKWGLNALTSLMYNLYGTEFAGELNVDARECIDDSRKLVEKWNIYR